MGTLKKLIEITLVPTNESKEKTRKYEELWIKIRDLIRSITKSSDGYDEKYMKMMKYLDYELPLNKMIELPSMTMNVRAIFLGNNKYYPQVFFRLMSL